MLQTALYEFLSQEPAILPGKVRHMHQVESGLSQQEKKKTFFEMTNWQMKLCPKHMNALFSLTQL